MRIFNVLTDEEIEKINKSIEKIEKWDDGKDTATGDAKNRKENFQITENNQIFVDEIRPKIQEIHSNAVVKSYTFAHALVSPRIASYKNGGHYDFHVDVSIMGQHRTDLSYTIWLTDQDEYEGGELVLALEGGQHLTVKGKKGQMCVYSTGLSHQVNAVTDGERRVIIGWLKSHIRDHHMREMLFRYGHELNEIKKEIGPKKVDTLNEIYHQLVRLSSD